jgi:Protein of unknown function (DUF2490)
MRNPFLWLIFFLPFSTSFAQNANPQDEFGNWNAWINSLVFSPKWKLDSDFHFRTWQVGKDPNNLIFRGGLTYVANPWLELQAGYGYFEFYSFGDAVDLKPNATEHRFHQQVFAKHKLKKFNINHRLRLEERLIQTPSKKTVWRPRHRLYISHPIVDKLYVFGAYEHFWTLSDWKFDQGRLHLGVGYQVGKNAKFEIAYLRHFLKNSVAYNRLQINFITVLKLKEEEKKGT